MPGIFQKFLYFLGITSPLMLYTILRHAIKNQLNISHFVCGILFLLIFTWHLFFFKCCINRLKKRDLNLVNIPSPADWKVITFTGAAVVFIFKIFDLILPFCFMEFTYNSLLAIGGCSILFMILGLTTNIVILSPWHLFLGYHYHTVNHFGKTYYLIGTKRYYRNPKSISSAKRVFEDVYIICD